MAEDRETLVSGNAPMVGVVVLNWNGWQDTIACVESLLNSDYSPTHIIICDNGSEDDSVKHLRAWRASRDRALADRGVPCPAASSSVAVTLVETGGNLGFARGNNAGIRYALSSGADYVFVLNNDTAVSTDCIKNLVEFGEKTTQAALMGPKILDESSMEYTQRAIAHRLNFSAILFGLSPLRHLVKHTRLFKQSYCFEDGPATVYAIPGSAMMFRAAILREIGLFDEATFLYWEEFIIAEKLRQRGLSTFLIPAAVISHKQGASISKIGARKFIENVKSERYFVTNYLCLSFGKRTVLSSVRFGAYVARACVDSNYRRNFRMFLKALVQG